MTSKVPHQIPTLPDALKRLRGTQRRLKKTKTYENAVSLQTAQRIFKLSKQANIKVAQ